MDPIFPLVIIFAIAGAAGLGWRVTRVRGARPTGRTSWTLLLGFCPRRAYSCPMVSDFRAGKDACSKCGNAIQGMNPMSQYQVEGRGTGLKLDPDGPLVASLCHGAWEPSKDSERLPQGDRHAPIFDLDYPAALASGPHGPTLVLKKPASVRAYRNVAGLMEAAGLAMPGCGTATDGDARRYPGIAGYRSPDDHLLIEAVFRLTCPATLVPSSTEGHFHLYLETETGWQPYLQLMRAMADAGLLEAGWVDMNERRKMAMLRKPHCKKAPT
ncbi:MAG TPA: hypothetical protein VL283_00020 [Candidatus Baltobacteraceae bacterium]|nr:hypothetical protein [Candidatus Baltobacteraceae bacterium]